jgi:hypothetical protein
VVILLSTKVLLQQMIWCKPLIFRTAFLHKEYLIS